jgi:hypothetical protein
MFVASLQYLPIVAPALLCILFLAAAVVISWAVLWMELAASKGRQAVSGDLLESAFIFATSAATVVLFMTGLCGMPPLSVSPMSVALGIVLFLLAGALLGVLRAVRALTWWRRSFLIAFAATATALLLWTAWEGADACRLIAATAAASRPSLPEPFVLAGLAALCLFLIGAFLEILFAALRGRRRDGSDDLLVRP